ncbi:protoporphyrinogen oxidase [Hymenobacter sp. M29]|uniref:Coproporphyrinogen III oxidase n=1 Tax=Hymenobacter mellowenesis TaxID=3063995 RepID=A0ABT9ADT4_9BACT|nr:protoporphyrinogen oxidase [Hymenobacter sp. M29]MDO7848008.1 protoporphyrinogen oxidase [Hymenobacter sp. M29]
MKIAIIGGGISGLTLAWHLQKAGVSYDLFEADERPGGNLRTWATPEGYLLETGPNSLHLSPELEELLADLGLSDQIQDAAAVSQHRYVLRDARYQILPSSPPGLLTNGFFSLKTKLRLFKEFRQPAAPLDLTETVGSFFRRRFGSEVVDFAVSPFVAGIYAGDPDQLLLHKTFPQLSALEQQHGSVLRGLMKTAKGQGKGVGRRRIVTLKNGIQTLTDTLAARLAHCQTSTAVTALSRATDGTYQLELRGARGPEAAPGYSHLALALPTYAAAPLLEPLFAAAAAALAAVHYPPMSVVFTAYDRAAVAHPLNGFGALHPKVGGTYTAGSVWTSSIYPNRVPAGQVLFTTFVGGTQHEEAAVQPEEWQKPAVDSELGRFYGITAGPRWQGRYVWPRSIPQFDAQIVGAHEAAAMLEADKIVAVANWRAGVSVPDCIRHARRTAEALAAEQ